MSSYSIDALSVLEKQALNKEACFIIGVWFYRGFNFKENHLTLLSSAVSHFYNTSLELEKRNNLFTQLLNFNNDYVAQFLSTIPSSQIPSNKVVNKSSQDYFNQIIQPLPITPSANSKELQQAPQDKSKQEPRVEANSITPIPSQYKAIPYTSAQNGQPAPIPQSAQNAIANQPTGMPISPTYDQRENSPMKHGPIRREGRNMPADAQNGSTGIPNSRSKSSKRRKSRKAKKRMQYIGQAQASPQLGQSMNPQQFAQSMNPQQFAQSLNPQQFAQSLNPQQFAQSLNPQQFAQSMNPQQFAQSMNTQQFGQALIPQQLNLSLNAQEVLQSMNSQKFTQSLNPQQFSQLNAQPYIQPIPQQISQPNSIYYPSSVPQSYYQVLSSQYPQATSIQNPQASSAPQDTCSVCMQGFIGSEILVQTYCRHKYHKECIAPTLAEVINLGTYPIKCLAGNCKFNIELPVIKAALPPSVSQRYEDLSHRYAVSPSDRFEFACPSCKAQTWVVKNVEQFICNGCKKYYCGRCKRIDHPGYICT
jgi:hypothetical protein